jgi:hypothetical protein
MDNLAHWQPALLWASGFSLFTLVATLAAVPWVVSSLPADYFSRPMRTTWHLGAGLSVAGLVLAVVKNALGLALLVLGFIMLFTPGQGLLTLLAGLLLMNFPGKYRLERWLVLRPGVLRGLNWMRQRGGHPPFEGPSFSPPA